MGRLSRIMWVDPKCHRMYPYKEAEGDLIPRECHTKTTERSEDAGLEDWSEAAASQSAGSHQTLEETRAELSPRASAGSTALLAP